VESFELGQQPDKDGQRKKTVANIPDQEKRMAVGQTTGDVRADFKRHTGSGQQISGADPVKQSRYCDRNPIESCQAHLDAGEIIQPTNEQ
jgi:hypothetical protein